MGYKLTFSHEAAQALKAFEKSGNKALCRKVFALTEELREHPQTGTGKPERLKHDRRGQWSRRINDEHRLTYRIDEDEETVYVLEMRDHYE
ncbi:MAG: Txe/YoeB family addiction module toxin [Alistipes sp.]|jgi:toxin YoeB|nr:Txe/YoeB family addiction module toxin [Alistipes sp.]